MRWSGFSGVRLAFVFLALLFSIFAKHQLRADGSPSGGLFTAEELEVRQALQKEFSSMGAKAHIIRGTRLYLKNPHQSKYYNINSLGFRGGEVERKKKNGYNIMVMGGSTVFGDWNKADYQTIPAILKSLLRERHPDRDINVYNLGITGYEFQREVDLAKRFWKQLDPDLIIFYHGGNDLVLAYSCGYLPIQPFDKESETLLAKKSGDNQLFHKQMEQLRIQMSGAVNRTHFGRKWLLIHRAEFVQGYLRDAGEIAAYFRKKGIPVIFILHPVLATRENKTPREVELAKPLDRKYRQIAGFYKNFLKEIKISKESEGLELYDFTDAFDRYDGELYFDEIHVNCAGNKIIAERMSKLIEGNRLAAGKGR